MSCVPRSCLLSERIDALAASLNRYHEVIWYTDDLVARTVSGSRVNADLIGAGGLDDTNGSLPVGHDLNVAEKPMDMQGARV